MRLTIRFSGIQPAVIEQAHRDGISVTEAWRRREHEGFGLLADAAADRLTQIRADLDSVAAADAEGALPMRGGAR
jgi:hypothetical protein